MPGRKSSRWREAGALFRRRYAPLANAGQLPEFAVRAVDRMPPGEDRIKYDHLFGAGDPENKTFWAQSFTVAGDLVNRYLAVRD